MRHMTGSSIRGSVLGAAALFVAAVAARGAASASDAWLWTAVWGVATAGSLAMAVLLLSQKEVRAIDSSDESLDERERALRNDGFHRAFGIGRALFLLIGAGHYAVVAIAGSTPTWLAETTPFAVILGAVAVAPLLPVAVVAWGLSDPVPDDDGVEG